MENSNHETSTIQPKKREDKYRNLQWSVMEHAIGAQKSLHRNAQLSKRKVTISKAFNHLLRRSVFGEYLEEFNHQNPQSKFLNDNKFGVTKAQLGGFSERQSEKLQKRNSLTDSMWEMLEECVEKHDIINLEKIQDKVRALRITNCHVNTFDRSLLRFGNLVVLVLCGNWIRSDVKGSWLPRQVRFLELYDNDVDCLLNLGVDPPRFLRHLGLGRNKLTNGSGLHLLANKKLFPRLTSLDLSDNDIYDLNPLLEIFQSLQQLDFLSLEGNPFYVLPNYKVEIVKAFPKLLYLDGTKILEEDRMTSNHDPEILKPQFLFNCFRLIGLPPPNKEGKVNQTIHVEIKLPLLEEISEEDDESDDDEEEEEKVEEEEAEEEIKEESKGESKVEVSRKRLSLQSDKNKQANKKEKEKKPPKEKKPTPYDKPDKFNPKRRNRSFFTERKNWAKVIEFPEVAIDVPEDDLVLLRDTFRTRVDLKIIYLQWQTPEMRKSEKKAQEKSAKKEKKEKKAGKMSEEVLKLEESEEKMGEKILKRVTLAKFCCELRSVNWSDESVDFYWAEHDDVGGEAISVAGSLKNIHYDDLPKEEKKQSDPGEKIEPEPAEQSEPPIESPVVSRHSKQKLPKMFTCQMGFGVRRSYSVSQISSTNKPTAE